MTDKLKSLYNQYDRKLGVNNEKKIKLKKTSPRRVLYLVAIAISGLLGLLWHQAWLQLYEDNHKADQVYLST